MRYFSGIANRERLSSIVVNILRTLSNNPRTPMDLGLTLINHLLVNDLKTLSTNKNVGDTIRKLAFKRFKDKTEKRGSGG